MDLRRSWCSPDAHLSLDDAPTQTAQLRATLADSSTPSTLLGIRAIAPRVADAVGVSLRPLGATFGQAIATVGLRNGYEVSTWTTRGAVPMGDEYQLAGRALLTIVAYVAGHSEELR